MASNHAANNSVIARIKMWWYETSKKLTLHVSKFPGVGAAAVPRNVGRYQLRLFVECRMGSEGGFFFFAREYSHFE